MENKYFFTNTADLLNLDIPVYAHKGSTVYEQRETLQEHTKRCEKYFERLLDKEKMCEAFDTIEPLLTGSTGQQYVDWFWQSLRDVISFHDTGKVNPVFQRDAMQNKAFEKIMIPELFERNHAMLSAYIYLDYHAAQLEEMQTKSPPALGTLINLYELVCINASLIMKHHANLSSFQEFINAISQGGKLYNMDTQMAQQRFRQIYKGKYARQPVHNYLNP